MLLDEIQEGETEMIETEIEDVVVIERISSATTATEEATLLVIAKAGEDHDLETEIEMGKEEAEEVDLLAMIGTDAKDKEDQEVVPEDLMIVTGPWKYLIEEVIDKIGIEEIEGTDLKTEGTDLTRIETNTEMVQTETERTEEMIEVIETEEREIDLLNPGMREATGEVATDPDLLLQGTEARTETTEEASLKRTDQRDQVGHTDLATEDRMALLTKMANVPQRDGQTARNRITNLSPEMSTVTERMRTSRNTLTKTA